MRRRDDEDLALDHIDDIGTQPPSDRDLTHAGPSHRERAPPAVSRPAADRTRAATTSASASYPEHLADQLRAARSAQERGAAHARTKRPRASLNSSGPPAASCAVGPRDPTALAFERERLKLAEHHAAMAAERERELAAQVPDRATWQAERRVLRERAAELETQLSIRRREHLHDALERPAPYLLASLGEPPEQPRARRTWRQAAQRIEAYRFDHAITDNHNALGPRPDATPARSAVAASTARPPPSPAPAWLPRRTQPRARAMNHDNGQALSCPTRPSGSPALEQPAHRTQYMPGRRFVSSDT